MSQSCRPQPPAPDAAGSVRSKHPRASPPRRSLSSSSNYRCSPPAVAAASASASADALRESIMHQRAMSASSLVSSVQTLGPASTVWPSKRAGRLASVLRTGLRKGPAPHTGPQVTTRARAATDISADYVSVSMATGRHYVGADLDKGGRDTPLPSASVSPTPTTRNSEPYTPVLSAAVSASAATIGHAPAAAQGAFRPRKRSLSVGGESSCLDFFARQVEQYGLQPLLTSPVATCYFLASNISNYTPETLLFYLEAEHYRTASFADSDRRTRYAKGIYKAFISHRAPLEINISHTMRLRITSAFRSGEPATSIIFQETQAHAYALLEQDFAQFRQRPLFRRMMTGLTAAMPLSSAAASGAPLRQGAYAQHLRAVAAVYDALASTYAIHSLPPGKTRLVETEAPLFTKFADMDLTSTELGTALPAWLCRTTIRLLDTPMPSSREELCHMLRTACSGEPRPPASLAMSAPPLPFPVAAMASASAPAAPSTDPAPTSAGAAASTKKASKQRSLQRLRLLLHHEPAADGPASAPAGARSRWDSLWGSRRRRP